MRLWDESIFAVNTFEMLENGQYFSLYYNGSPDLFNTKPPLLNWLQILSVQLLGYNEFALRLPSGLAAGGTVLVLFTFLKQYFTLQYAWVAALILLSAPGFIGYHTARTGDTDSLLTFMLTLSILQFLSFLMNQNKSAVYWTMFFLTLAFLTKLHAAFLFLPAFLFILIIQKKLKTFFMNVQFLLGILTFIGLCGTVLYIRELQTPGYFTQIIFKDAGRLFQEFDTHGGPFYFYLDNLFSQRYGWWMICFLGGLILIVMNKKCKERIALIPLLIMVFTYLLIISFSATKLIWYDMPLYPLLAIVSAFPIVYFLNHLGIQSRQSSFIVGVLFFYPLFLMFRTSQDNSIEIGDRRVEANEMFLYEAFKFNRNMDNVKVLYHGWNGSLLFYKYKFSTINQHIELHTDFEAIKKGDRVLVKDLKLIEHLRRNFHLTELSRGEYARMYRLE